MRELVYYFKDTIDLARSALTSAVEENVVADSKLAEPAGEDDRGICDSGYSSSEGSDDEDAAERKTGKESPEVSEVPLPPSSRPPTLQFTITVSRLEAIVPRNTASIESTALLADKIILRNVTDLKVTDLVHDFAKLTII